MKVILRGAILTALSVTSSLVATSAMAQQADVWVTYPDQSKLLSWDGKRSFDNNGSVDGNTITMDPGADLQEIDGFGASMTESSAWLIQNRMSASQRAALLEKLFGFNDGAAGMSYVRIPLGASDFSNNSFTFDETCCDLNDFNASRATNLLGPLLRTARQHNSSLKLMGTPWTPPSWMKTSGSMNGGKLNQHWYPLYATYLRRTYDAFNSAGMRFDSMTPQNEPGHGTGDYPSAQYDWYEELNFVRDHLAPRMQGTGVKLFTLDHNWDMEWYATSVLREGTAYAGSAWHCYNSAGNNAPPDPTAMTRVHNQYPNKEIHFTECTASINDDFAGSLKWHMQNLFIPALRNWSRSVMMWNIALDTTGGPKNGGCGSCRGLVTINQSNGSVTYNDEFYVIGHFARFVWPGARRIPSSNSSNGNFINVAFRNAGGKKAAVVLNKGSSTQTFRLVENGKSVAVALPAGAVATVFW